MIGTMCSVSGCERRIHARKLCEMHYRRLMRTGDIGQAEPLQAARRYHDPDSALDRFKRLLVVDDDGCWLWQGAKTTAGYAEFHVEGRTQYAHRWVYERLVGPIEDDTIDHVCHSRDPSCPGGSQRCKHRRCVNPLHLEDVSYTENNRRGRERTI